MLINIDENKFITFVYADQIIDRDKNNNGYLGNALVYELSGHNGCTKIREYFFFKDRTFTDLGKFKKYMYGYDYYI